MTFLKQLEGRTIISVQFIDGPGPTLRLEFSGGTTFEATADYDPRGDHPQAILMCGFVVRGSSVCPGCGGVPGSVHGANCEDGL